MTAAGQHAEAHGAACDCDAFEPSTRPLAELAAGDRFRVEQFPEGVITGRVDLEVEDGGAFVEVEVDGDEGLSSWPADTQVEPIAGPA